MSEAGAKSGGYVEPQGNRSCCRRPFAGVAIWLALFAIMSSSSAQEFTPAIHVLGMHQGSDLSDIASGLAEGGYELSDGTWVPFSKWYHTDWPETYVDMMTQVSEDFGILWGFGTGEHAEKYAIEPSFTLGFVAQAHPSANSVLSLTATATAWGTLTERTCEADYGEIGGLRTVNCRLAASLLPPEETLQYLVNAEPNRLHLSLSFSATF